MYAVIFKAKTNKLDKAYFKMAERMRELAISYWESIEQIQKWKQNSEHLVEIVEVISSYNKKV